MYHHLPGESQCYFIFLELQINIHSMCTGTVLKKTSTSTTKKRTIFIQNHALQSTNTVSISKYRYSTNRQQPVKHWQMTRYPPTQFHPHSAAWRLGKLQKMLPCQICEIWWHQIHTEEMRKNLREGEAIDGKASFVGVPPFIFAGVFLGYVKPFSLYPQTLIGACVATFNTCTPLKTIQFLFYTLRV